MTIGITITGADDSIEPSELARLSDWAPFVEWGILDSYNRRGTPRYPSNDWLDALADVSMRFWCKYDDEMRLSSHVCGSRAREVMTTGGSLFHGMYQRAQINGWRNEFAAEFGYRHEGRFEWILQCRSEEELPDCAASARAMGRASVLYDPSGGRGLRPMQWPIAPSGVKIGFAGGITPENLTAIVAQIERHTGLTDNRVGKFWIDMESGVRTDDKFDLSKVEAAIKALANMNADKCGIATRANDPPPRTL
jgi:hypothetical protein